MHRSLHPIVGERQAIDPSVGDAAVACRDRLVGHDVHVDRRAERLGPPQVAREFAAGAASVDQPLFRDPGGLAVAADGDAAGVVPILLVPTHDERDFDGRGRLIGADDRHGGVDVTIAVAVGDDGRAVRRLSRWPIGVLGVIGRSVVVGVVHDGLRVSSSRYLCRVELATLALGVSLPVSCRADRHGRRGISRDGVSGAVHSPRMCVRSPRYDALAGGLSVHRGSWGAVRYPDVPSMPCRCIIIVALYNTIMNRIVSAAVCGLALAVAVVGGVIVAGLVWASGYGLAILWRAYRRRCDHAQLRRTVAARPGIVRHDVVRNGGVLAVQCGAGPITHLRLRDVHLAGSSWTAEICRTTAAWLDAGPYAIERSPDGDLLTRGGRTLGEHLVHLGLATHVDAAPITLREPQTLARLRQLGQWSPVPTPSHPHL